MNTNFALFPYIIIYFSSQDSSQIDQMGMEENSERQIDQMGMEEPSERQLKTMSLQEYKTLMQLIPQIQELKNTIFEKIKLIELKDLQLRDQQKKSIDVSNLSVVSFYYIPVDFLSFTLTVLFCIFFKQNMCNAFYMK